MRPINSRFVYIKILAHVIFGGYWQGHCLGDLAKLNFYHQNGKYMAIITRTVNILNEFEALKFCETAESIELQGLPSVANTVQHIAGK